MNAVARIVKTVPMTVCCELKWIAPSPHSKPRRKTMLRRKLETQENRDFWAFVDRMADEVAKWPVWMRQSVVFSERDIIKEQEEGAGHE